MTYFVGVDTGGTFTDFVLFDTETQTLGLHKYPSTPQDPSAAMVEGLSEVLPGQGITPADLASLAHGTTVAINAVLQDHLPEIGMITTEGFRDVLELARQRRPHLYNLDIEKPRPLAPRRLRLEVPERIDVHRRIQIPLDEEAVELAAKRLKEAGVPAVAICFLHAYGNSVHERRARTLLKRAFPGVLVSISSEVLREFREFERFSTTTLNAALLPVMRRYLDRLGRQVKRLGVPSPPRISSSYGGTVALRTAKERPTVTLMSGPSAGVVGATAVAGASGYRDLITLDMGGTSTDVCLVHDGTPLISRERQIGGWPVLEPSLDVHSIGAGGGSILWVDEGGFLRVGPQSAGARPGPACYGLGGTRATVTDANLVARRLSPSRELGGRVALQETPAREALEMDVSGPMGFSMERALYGANSVLTSNLARAVRVVSVERGYDPRTFTLVAFGGAGPMHATHLAAEMGIGTVLVPDAPGVLCALGLLMAAVRAEFSQSHVLALDGLRYPPGSHRTVERVFAGLESRASKWLRSEGIDRSSAGSTRVVEMRYAGQGHQLPIVAYSNGNPRNTVERLVDDFHTSYQRGYGYARRGTPVEMVHFRIQVSAPGPQPELKTRPSGDGDYNRALISSRDVYLGEGHGFAACPVYWRPSLEPGDRFPGPAVIEQMDSTTVLLPGQEACVDHYMSLLIST
jgi:N-methylhydantoinase A